MNGKKTCQVCKRVDPLCGIGSDGCCLDVVECAREFAFIDMADQENREAGSR